MLKTLAIRNYRSLLDLVMPLGRLNVVTGPNGSGKSNLYRALRLLSETAQTGVVSALAREGGLRSTFWAGPQNLSHQMQSGEHAVQGSAPNKVKRLRLGFASEEFGYSISLGLPVPDPQNGKPSAFHLDPEIKRECIWAGKLYHSASSVLDRRASSVKIRSSRKWEVTNQHLANFDSVLGTPAIPGTAPGVIQLRGMVRSWRFYD